MADRHTLNQNLVLQPVATWVELEDITSPDIED